MDLRHLPQGPLRSYRAERLSAIRRSTRRQFMATQRPTAFKPATHCGAPGLQPSYSWSLLQLLGQGAPGGGLQRPHLLL
jgi:hypothetical protein